jgi:hypothetical protein
MVQGVDNADAGVHGGDAQSGGEDDASATTRSPATPLTGSPATRWTGSPATPTTGFSGDARWVFR